MAQSEVLTNLEPAADGSHLEGYTPGGTRVATPIPTPQPGASSKTPRPSYAAALKQTPSDWHLDFFLGDRPVSLDTTIYGAVHQFEVQQGVLTSRTMWSNVYTVRFRKVTGPVAASLSTHATPEPAEQEENPLAILPESIPPESRHAKILQLLRALHNLNEDLPELQSEEDKTACLPQSSFISNKLTAKLNRQLEEPMIVASSCLPDWALDLPQSFPFLFPFESRFSFLQSTSFGYARLMQKWVGQARQESRRDENLGFLGRLQRQKVRIARERLLESAFKVFELYGQSRAMLELVLQPLQSRFLLNIYPRIEFFAEVGTGLGPTLEFCVLH